MAPPKFFYSVLLAFICFEISRAAPRPVNISNSWVLVDAGYPVFYRYFRDKISWYEADAVCQFHHGNLVTVNTGAQFDAVRSYLKELNIVSNIWIGLMRSNENIEFIWSSTNQPVSTGMYWAEQTPKTNPLCAATDPARDFRWHALGCGGPEIASFICELPVPPWATGAQGCLIPSMPALTIIYLPESSALEMTADCGSDGTRRIACKGNSDQSEMIHHLTCPEVGNKISSTKTQSSTPYSTNAIKLATKPWLWASNTIDTGDFGPPTRHRRETEGMLSTAGEFSITKESSTTPPKDITEQKMTKTTEAPTTKIVEAATTNAPTTQQKVSTTQKTPMSTTESVKITSADVKTTTVQNIVTTLPTKIQLTTLPEKETTEFSSINQDVLFNLPENGTVFDIIEVNDNLTDYSEKRKENHKLLEETTTKGQATTKLEEPLSTDVPIYTTISFYKEAPSRSPSDVPITSTNSENLKNTTDKKQDLITSAEQEKTFIKAIENSSNSLVKLNRTSRKELPLIDFNTTSEEKIESQEDKNDSRDIIEDKHDHRVVEITLMHHENKEKEGGKLFVTTKKHDKLTKMRKDKVKMIENEKAKTKSSFLDKNKMEKLKPDDLDDKKLPSEVSSLLQNKTNTPEIKLIDPKLVDLNFNKTKNNNSERIPIKLQEKFHTTTEFSKEDITELDDYAKDLEITNIKTTEEPVEPEPEAQPRPNRNRVLTRPQRRSFYPYFFSRVLG